MPSKLPETLARSTGMTIRFRTHEREHLGKVASARGVPVSVLIREGLEATGTLPKELASS